MDQKVPINRIKDYIKFTVSDEGRVSVCNPTPTTGRFEVKLQDGDVRRFDTDASLFYYREGSRVFLEGPASGVSSTSVESALRPRADISVRYNEVLISVNSSGLIVTDGEGNIDGFSYRVK